MEYCSSELFDKAAAPRNDSKINQSFKNIWLALFLTQKNQERRERDCIKVIAEWWWRKAMADGSGELVYSRIFSV
jgi:hypothetical protein